MSKVFVAFLALCIIQLSLARVAREAPPASSDPWQDVLNAARETFETLHKAVLNVNGVRTDDELATKVQTEAKSLGDSLRTEIAQLTEEAQKNAGKFNGVYKQFTDKLAEVATDLQNKNKDLFSGDTKKLQENVEANLKEVVEKTDELQKKLKVEGENISGKLETLLSKIVEQTTNAAKELSKSIEKKN